MLNCEIGKLPKLIVFREGLQITRNVAPSIHQGMGRRNAFLAVKERHDILAGMVNGRWGIKWSAGDLREMAIRALREEKEFNRRAGLGPATDRLPEIFSEEANPSSGTRFDFSPEELDGIGYH